MTENREPEIINKSAFTVVGLKYRGKDEQGEVRELWDRFQERLEELQQVGAAEGAYGLIDNFDEESGEFDYLAGVEVAADSAVPSGLEAWELDAQNYAVFPTTLETLEDTFRYAYEQWMPESNYRRTPGPEFEYYSGDFNPDDSDSPFDLYIPVEPLSGGE